MKFADYERRLLAFIIDLGISILFTTAMLSVLGILIYEFRLSLAIKIFIPSTCFILFCYLVCCYRLCRGVSIGGAICNVRIINKDQRPLRFKTCFIRAALLSLLLLSIYNIFYMFLLRTQVSFFDESTDTRAVERIPTENINNQ